MSLSEGVRSKVGSPTESRELVAVRELAVGVLGALNTQLASNTWRVIRFAVIMLAGVAGIVLVFLPLVLVGNNGADAISSAQYVTTSVVGALLAGGAVAALALSHYDEQQVVKSVATTALEEATKRAEAEMARDLATGRKSDGSPALTAASTSGASA